VSAPNSTESASIVAETVTSPVPSNDAEPERSPPRDIVLAVSREVAVAAFPV